MMNVKSMRGELYLLFATLLAGVGWIASKLVVLEMPGPVFIGVRFFVASLILLPFCIHHIRQLSIKQILSLCGVGLLLSASLQVWVFAVSVTESLSEGAFIMSLAMIIAPFVSWILFRVKPNRAFWMSFPIAIIGMLLLTLGNGWNVEQSQIYFLLASMLLSIHFVMNKRVITNIKPIASICIQLFVVGVSGLAFASMTTQPEFEITKTLVFWFIVSAVVATSIRYLLQTVGQHSVNMEVAALIMILEPVWTLLLSVGVLGESVETQKLLGGTVIIASLFCYIKWSRRK
ncbi:MAG: DMT family transporter [Vibrio toranzoniae]|jgi:drug/metabolite transporter (DMT)-like permease|uniref:DMT family transporter n=1 Tax=Vibrio TaxID=662 RepID=UPI00137810D6|nr:MULTISPECIES: DMT family transporter [Vibrio]MDA0145027.1 DMT family transporter [Vibrio sp. RW]NAZ53329.1 EamA family transporter [Vibrio toranzoniae]NAZ68818.1 EamA family transporter [Vibrio toranzoniae]NAZ91841.1 EamA family transporter [Vibrio toranzoniae]